MSRGYFVTGTDTGVGKTCASLGLMRALQSQGYSVGAMKPVASGCVGTGAGLLNDDALQLQAHSSVAAPYAQVNPYAFEPPIAPHLAAEAVGVQIEIPRIQAAFRKLITFSDKLVVEGVGGWLVPINGRQTMADVAVALGLPVILVVGIQLGCLNHALLAAESIRRSGAHMAGWIANRIDADCAWQSDNIRALCQRIEAPLLADYPYLTEKDSTAEQFGKIDLGRLQLS